MGLFSKIIFGAAKKTGANKNDAKIAEIEYKKQKLASKEAKQERKENKKKSKEQLLIDNAIASIVYSYSNLPEIRTYLCDFESEMKHLSSRVAELKQARISKEEKRELSKAKEKLEQDLPYLYLSKDYFSYSLKVANGMKLKPNEYIFLAKFIHFFDGVRVIDVDDDEEGTMLSEFKEIGQDLFGIKTSFDFYDFTSRHEEDVEEYKVPNLQPMLDAFSKLNIDKLTNNVEEENVKEEKSINEQQHSLDSLECPNCGAPIKADSKFCPNCGNKIEFAPKKKFCSQCGCQLEANARFCPQCGSKVE